MHIVALRTGVPLQPLQAGPKARIRVLRAEKRLLGAHRGPCHKMTHVVKWHVENPIRHKHIANDRFPCDS
jgi:hypothetical protein